MPATYKDIAIDWKRNAYSDIVVVKSEDRAALDDYTLLCPPTHPETVITRPWYGTDIGCDCIGVNEGSLDLGGMENRFEKGRFCYRNHTASGCRQVPA